MSKYGLEAREAGLGKWVLIILLVLVVIGWYILRSFNVVPSMYSITYAYGYRGVAQHMMMSSSELRANALTFDKSCRMDKSGNLPFILRQKEKIIKRDWRKYGFNLLDYTKWGPDTPADKRRGRMPVFDDHTAFFGLVDRVGMADAITVCWPVIEYRCRHGIAYYEFTGFDGPGGCKKRY